MWPSISETIFGCAPTKQDRRGGAAEVANPLEARLLEDAAVIDVRELGRTERTRLETLADGAELDPGSAREMHVPVRVHLILARIELQSGDDRPCTRRALYYLLTFIPGP